MERRRLDFRDSHSSFQDMIFSCFFCPFCHKSILGTKEIEMFKQEDGRTVYECDCPRCERRVQMYHDEID